MKIQVIKQMITLVSVSIISISLGLAQDDCKVSNEKLAGQYEGDCKKGLAHGTGIAKGEDQYAGEFKKGLPHGTGTYTWASGDIYVGEFKNGDKNGKGEMKIFVEDGLYSSKSGFWVKDEYIGEYEHPYEIHYKSPEVLSVKISEAENPSDDGTALFIEFSHKGRNVKMPRFSLTESYGSYTTMHPSGKGSKVLVVKFPFRFTVGYMGETMDIEVCEAKSWNIKIDVNK